MTELSLIEIIKFALKALINSKVFILVILELSVIITGIVFSHVINKKMVRNVSIGASALLLIFYLMNYINALTMFINNVSTQFIEFIYFPSTLEFASVMLISIIIMSVTLINKKYNKVLKVVNTIIPISISLLLLCMIEYINESGITFNEFSIFTDTNLMSLNELAMTLFIIWIIGLIVYKIDMLIINNMNEKTIVEMPIEKDETKEYANLIKVDLNSISYKDNDDDEIEMPKLKSAK
ncbi:MAG TPA: hypothetical protein PLB45_02985 [Bacilli bacterium]|jgi:hypothetical protein|nr:hypothetical protein [Bacilli bacterium]HQC83819.1 hypothetical protein [Bacilli bacterium]